MLSCRAAVKLPVIFFLCFCAFYRLFQTNPYYVKPRLADHQFGIKHYAGEVSYVLMNHIRTICVDAIKCEAG